MIDGASVEGVMCVRGVFKVSCIMQFDMMIYKSCLRSSDRSIIRVGI